MRAQISARFPALAGAIVLAAGLTACGKPPAPEPGASGAQAASVTAAQPASAQPEVAAPQGPQPPLECGAATSAEQCVEILKMLGKDPAAAHGTPGNEPVYTGVPWEPLPSCKSGAAECEAWERAWPQ